MSVNSKMTAIANEIRELSGTTGTMGLDAMATRVSEANDEVGSQVNLISQIQTALQGKAAGGSGGGNSELVKQIIDGTVTEVSDSSVESIRTYAFAECSSLTTVSFPAATTIGSSAFEYCPSLTTVSFPAATDIRYRAFYYCSRLTNVNFPQATIIGSYAFEYCTSLTTANFPAAKTFGYSAFDCCSHLTTASFPQATIIGSAAFNYCFRLTTVSFPQATTIGASAFYTCYSLATVSFPVATTIETGAFYRCSRLTSVFLANANVTKLSHSDAFWSTSMSTTGWFYVPSSLIASYKAATNWVYYSSRFSAIENSSDWDGVYGDSSNSGDGTIVFYVDGNEYQYEEGMTWVEWRGTPYNLDHFLIDDFNVWDSDASCVLYDSRGNVVKGAHTIIADEEYYFGADPEGL